MYPTAASSASDVLMQLLAPSFGVCCSVCYEINKTKRGSSSSCHETPFSQIRPGKLQGVLDLIVAKNAQLIGFDNDIQDTLHDDEFEADLTTADEYDEPNATTSPMIAKPPDPFNATEVRDKFRLRYATSTTSRISRSLPVTPRHRMVAHQGLPPRHFEQFPCQQAALVSRSYSCMLAGHGSSHLLNSAR
ncbi:hypothetical protein HPB52_010410 [Rhipicephalus sanguineus]|uniref:Uncharacterized protein n=1 Tax=Rhipicephalus sanguineus TaxID=34632 RepID=A0A9D4T9B5_RHISA|nr:hypothetical protein HPB52_010410 [Rhipicephalus sanguineus]